MKKITITNIKTDEDDGRILMFLNEFLKENFQHFKEIKVEIEDES